MTARFLEAEGLVHIENAAHSEYTLCGDAFDLASDELGYEWHETKSRVVTCPICAAIIKDCRGVKTKENSP